MSLFPAEDILTKEIESWRSFAASLNSEEYKEIFNKMLADCYKYAKAINAKGEPFPAEPLLLSLLLSQQKMIDRLSAQNITKPVKSNCKDNIYCDDLEWKCRPRIYHNFWMCRIFGCCNWVFIFG